MPTHGGIGIGRWLDPALNASAFADLGFDFLAPGEFGGGPQLPIATDALDKYGIKLAGAGPNLTAARRPAFQEVPQGLVTFLHACPGDNLCGPRATNTVQGVNPLGMTIWNTVTQEQFNQLRRSRPRSSRAGRSPTWLSHPRCPPSLPAAH